MLGHIKELNNTLNRLKKELKVEENTTSVWRGEPDRESMKFVTKFSGWINDAKQVTQTGLDTYWKWDKEKKAIAEVDKLIEENKEKIERYKKFEDSIYESLQPILGKGGLADEFGGIPAKLENKSQITLDFERFNIKGKLKEIKTELKKIIGEFAMSNDLMHCIDKQEEVITTFINIYDRIESYKREKKLGAYIAAIASASASRISVQDRKLEDKILEMEIAIRSNMVLKEYEIATNALKQWTFPFASVYLSELKVPSQLADSPDLNSLVEKATNQIKVIINNVLKYKSSIHRHDHNLHNATFNSDYVSTSPFFVFDKKSNKEMIADLLAGKEVLAKADILESDPKKEAIKFNLIEVNFKIKDKAEQAKLDAKLKGFRMSATHLGNSFYRAGNKIYSISGPSQKIEYSFEKNNKGKPVDSNIVYQKIKVINEHLTFSESF